MKTLTICSSSLLRRCTVLHHASRAIEHFVTKSVIAARSRSSRSPTFRVGCVDSIESRGKSTLGSREEEMERHSFRAGKSSVWSFVFTSTIGENKKGGKCMTEILLGMLVSLFGLVLPYGGPPRRRPLPADEEVIPLPVSVDLAHLEVVEGGARRRGRGRRGRGGPCIFRSIC